MLCFSEAIIRLELMRQAYEIAQCCSERLGHFQSAVYIWVLPVVVKQLCDCNGEVKTIHCTLYQPV